jgi:hypothetical protein
MDEYSVDIKEISSILSNIYDGESPESEEWIVVAERMGSEISNDYLLERGNDIKRTAKKKSSIAKISINSFFRCLP